MLDLLHATEGDINTMELFIKKKIGSPLWINVFHNIIEIRKNFEDDPKMANHQSPILLELADRRIRQNYQN